MIYIEQFERGVRVGYGRIERNDLRVIEGQIELNIPPLWEGSTEEYAKFVVRGLGNAQQWMAEKTGFKLSDTPL